MRRFHLVHTVKRVRDFYKFYIFNYIHNFLKSEIWIFVSLVTKMYTKHAKLNNINYEIENIYFLTPENYSNKVLFYSDNYKIKAYSGPDLNLRLKCFLTEKTNLKVIDASASDLAKGIKPKSVVITWIGPNPKSFHSYIYLIKILYFSIKFRKKNTAIITYLPDTWFPDAAAVAALLNVFTGGWSVQVQSSLNEARDFGYPVLGNRVLWTFPPSLIRQRSLVSWSDKQSVALLSFSPAGGQKRLFYAQLLEVKLKNLGFKIIRADGNLSDNEYQEALNISKIVFTTNFTQDGFYFGSRKYRSRISPNTITGMTWDAFSTKSLLICNSNPALNEIGFIEDQHFLDLDKFLNGKKMYTSDENIKKLANLGHKQFLKLTSSNYIF